MEWSCSKITSRKYDYAFINQHEEEFYRHKDDMECVAKHPCRVMERIIKKDKEKGSLDCDISSML
jgi:hypothetical protein